MLLFLTHLSISGSRDVEEITDYFQSLHTVSSIRSCSVLVLHSLICVSGLVLLNKAIVFLAVNQL